jgi:hypothetical protein
MRRRCKLTQKSTGSTQTGQGHSLTALNQRRCSHEWVALINRILLALLVALLMATIILAFTDTAVVVNDMVDRTSGPTDRYISQMRLANSLGERPGIARPW